MRGFSHSLHLRERIIAPREKAYFSTGDSTKKKSNDQILSEERLPSLSLTKVKKKL